MNTRYKIVITKVEDKITRKQGEWTVIEKRPWTQKEFNEETGRMYGTSEAFLEKNPLKSVYGYTPEREVTVQEEVKVLEQTVEAIDLAAVIKAVNNI